MSPRHTFAALALAAILGQLALASATFPIAELTTSVPVFHVDHAYHWYQVEVARSLAAHGAVIGYDPHFGAGYLAGIHFNGSAKGPAALGVLLLPFASTTVAYKLYLFLATLLTPICVPLAAHWLRFPRSAVAAAAALGMLLWWVSSVRWYYATGMAGHVVGSYLALPYGAFVFRYLTESTSRSVPVALVLAGAVGFLIYPLFPIPVASVVIPLAVAFRSEIGAGRAVSAFVAVPLLSAIPNLPWLLPTITIVQPYMASVTYLQASDISIAWNEALGRFVGAARGARLYTVLWFAALWACVPRHEPRAKRIAVALAAGAGALILLSATGASLPVLAQVQPNRFSASAYIVLALPASYGLVLAFRRLATPGWRRWIAGGSVTIFVLAAFFFLVWELPREVSSADIPHHGARPPEVRGLGDKSKWMLNWLKTETTPDARILFETHHGSVVFDRSELSGYFALSAGREFVGGPFPHLFYAGFTDGALFGADIDSLAPRHLTELLRRYNIGWIVAFSEKSKRSLDASPSVRPLESFDDVKTYAVDGPHSYFLEGTGVVTARAVGRVELDRLSGPSVVLKYHYVPGLRAVPPTEIVPFPVEGDPTPFVRLVDPPPRLVLRLP